MFSYQLVLNHNGGDPELCTSCLGSPCQGSLKGGSGRNLFPKVTHCPALPQAWFFGGSSSWNFPLTATAILGAFLRATGAMYPGSEDGGN